uniref:enolase-phosphatase E1-like n=1 Tax=Semicossyphus pulcher TaxID=241346 RepID=UPI0037E91895
MNSKQAQNRKVVKDKMLSGEFCNASKDAENLQRRNPNEDQSLQEGEIEDSDSDGTEQEAFEILDSRDDQTETEDVSQKLATSSAQISKEDERPLEEEEDKHQVIDSLEDQPTTTETESETDKGRIRTKKGEATASKCDRPSRRSGPKSKVSVSEEKEKSPKKQDRTVKKYETWTKMDTIADKEVTEESGCKIVDSVEEESVEDAATREWSGRRRSTRGKKEDRVNINLTEASEKPEEVTYEIIDSVENETANDEPTVTRRSSDILKEQTSPIISTSDTVILERENKQKSPENEKEDYPDDIAEEKELRKHQATTKETQFPKEQETRKTRERAQRSQRSSSKGEGDRGEKKRMSEDGKVVFDTEELVTLDTVGADEAVRQQWEEEVTEGEVQELVSLDEFVEEEPEGKAEQSKLETPPLSQEEVGDDDEDKPEKEQAQKTLRSGKRKHDDDTEGSMNFVILDEVKDEEKREASKPRTRGRPRKKARQTPVRKSTRGKNVSSQEEREKENESTDEVPPTPREASLLDKSQSKPEIQEIAEVEAASPVDIDAAFAGQEQQPENKTLEGCVEEEEEGRSRADIKVVSKQRKESVGPEAK